MILIWEFVLGDATAEWAQLLDELKTYADDSGDDQIGQLQALLSDFKVAMVTLKGVLDEIQGITDDASIVWKELILRINDKGIRHAILYIIALEGLLTKQFSSGNASVNIINRFVNDTLSKMEEALGKDNAWFQWCNNQMKFYEGQT